MSEVGEGLSAFTSQYSTRRNHVWTVTPNDEESQLAQLAELVKLGEDEKPALSSVLERVQQGALKGLNETGASFSSFLFCLVSFFFVYPHSHSFRFARSRRLHTSCYSSHFAAVFSHRPIRRLNSSRRDFPSWPECWSSSLCKVKSNTRTPCPPVSSMS
jgi:hypothetical protein